MSSQKAAKHKANCAVLCTIKCARLICVSKKQPALQFSDWMVVESHCLLSCSLELQRQLDRGRAGNTEGGRRLSLLEYLALHQYNSTLV